MNSTTIHKVVSIRMNAHESAIERHDGSIRRYKVITLVSEDRNGHKHDVTFFTDSLDLDLQGSLE